MAVDTVSDAALVEMWRSNLRKSQRAVEPDQPRPATMNYQFGGGSIPIAVAVDPLTLASTPTTIDPLKLSVPFPSRLIWARLCAGDAAGLPVVVTATVDVQLTSFETFGAQTPLYGTGAIPTITLDSVADCDLTGWQTSLITGDWLIARLTAFTGLATWLALELLLRPTRVQIGVQGILDQAGDQIVDENGNVIVLRS